MRKPQASIIDPLEFKGNKCTENGKYICTITKDFETELWFDKHYHDRHLHGDENGKRHGIEPKQVEDLVNKSIKFLVLFSASIKGFKFLNYPEQSEKLAKVVLKEDLAGEMLNVVIEVHYLGIDKYEITVKTAMCVDDFRIESGQFCVEIYEGGATLKQWINNHLVEVCNF